MGLRLMGLVGSERDLRVVGKRPTKPESQGLECHRTQGERIWVFERSESERPKTIQIDPHRRHVDKSTVAYFWKTLDTWMAMHKPTLMST
jgi:hypothetical protein